MPVPIPYPADHEWGPRRREYVPFFFVFAFFASLREIFMKKENSMNRWFNTEGPCRPEWHYMLPPMARLQDVMQLIEQSRYFVVHGPRQTGKTTALRALAQELTASGQYVTVLVSMETGAPFSDDIGAAELTILDDWRRKTNHNLPADLLPPPWPDAPPGGRIGAALQAWAEASPRPHVIFLDEIDALKDVVLLSVLRQLRSGYDLRPDGFPWSLALIGMRDVRDYKVASGGSERLNTSSPFNIKARSLLLRNFTEEEVATLYQQHTNDTGQVFMPDVMPYAFDLTQGQPWLVNALAQEITSVLETDHTKPITRDHVDKAKQALIIRQDTHLDSLAARLVETRIRNVIEPILAGQIAPDIPVDDIRFVQDLGLCRYDMHAGLLIANPIYREIIPKMLSYSMMTMLPAITPFWFTDDGKLDPNKLLEAFLAFWRKNAEPLFKSAPYHEIAPHLVMMAFLHRVVNAGGTIDREYAVGSGRMDLCIRYRNVTLAIELKVWRPNESDPLYEGLVQLDDYLAGLELDSGWLVIFDRRPDIPPVQHRTTMEHATTPSGRNVIVIRA